MKFKSGIKKLRITISFWLKTSKAIKIIEYAFSIVLLVLAFVLLFRILNIGLDITNVIKVEQNWSAIAALATIALAITAAYAVHLANYFHLRKQLEEQIKKSDELTSKLELFDTGTTAILDLVAIPETIRSRKNWSDLVDDIMGMKVPPSFDFLINTSCLAWDAGDLDSAIALRNIALKVHGDKDEYYVSAILNLASAKIISNRPYTEDIESGYRLLCKLESTEVPKDNLAWSERLKGHYHLAKALIELENDENALKDHIKDAITQFEISLNSWYQVKKEINRNAFWIYGLSILAGELFGVEGSDAKFNELVGEKKISEICDDVWSKTCAQLPFRGKYFLLFEFLNGYHQNDWDDFRNYFSTLLIFPLPVQSHYRRGECFSFSRILIKKECSTDSELFLAYLMFYLWFGRGDDWADQELRKPETFRKLREFIRQE